MNESADLFRSFDDLQAIHSELLDRHERLGESAQAAAAFWTEVEEFLERAQATGALFHESSDRMERRASQSILDYWTNTLHRADRRSPVVRLAPYDEERAPTLPDKPCPYQGLSAFDEDRHEFFFGRETLVNKMVEKLRDGERLLIVMGASGSGKSSVVRAGLLQALKMGVLPGSEGWRQVTMVPGADPMANLQRALHRSAPAATSAPVPAADSAQSLTGPEEEPIVLVVDQFEELFTLCDDRETYRDFEGQLLRLVDEPRPRHIVIVTMRTDFARKLPLLPGLHRRLEAARVDVEALGIEELRDAILKPAAKVHLKFDPAVVDDLVTKILGVRAGLPLLQFALLQLWTERDKNRVTEAVYREVGDPLQALGRSADRFFNKLIREDQKAVERIFLRMVRIEEREETSRRVPLKDVLETAKVKDRTESMVHHLICEARLIKLTGTSRDICSEEFGFSTGKLSALTEEESKRGNVLQIEVAHEALVRNWDTLGEWLDEERVRLATRRRHDGKAAEWVRLGEKSAGLLDEVELLEVRRWLDSPEAAEVGYDPALPRLVDASQEAIEKVEQEKQEAAKRLRLRARWLAILSVVVAILLVIASVLAGLSIRNAAKARRSTTSLRLAVAAIRNLETDPDPELGLLLAYYAARETYQPDRAVIVEAEDALHQALQVPLPELTLAGHLDAVYGVSYSPDGKYLATASTDGTAKVWDADTGEEIISLAGHRGAVVGIAFSPDGTRLATASADTTAKLWDVETGDELFSLGGHTGAVNGIAFSPDGMQLATASADGTARTWDTETGEKILTLAAHTLFVNSVTFSPDGRRLATASADRTAMLWDVETGQVIQTLSGHTNAVLHVAFSPDGRHLVTASADRTVKVWDAESGKEMRSLTGHSGVVYGIAFSPDGASLATASADQTVKLWDAASWQELSTLQGHTGAVRDIAYHPDGLHIATASADKTAKVWDPNSKKPLILRGHTAAINGVAFDSNGERLATASADKTAKIWDIETGEVQLGLVGHTGAVNAVAFSPDGEWLATASADGTAKVWDTASGMTLLTLTDHRDAVNSVAFSQDGTRTATASADRTVKVWDTSTGQVLLTLTGHSAEILRVAFSPDRANLLTSSGAETWKVWDLASGQEVNNGTYSMNRSAFSVAYSPDRERFVTGSAEGTVTMWDASTGVKLFSLAGHSGAVSDTAFSADGKRLATASADGTAHVYVLDVEALLELARQRATRELTPRECVIYWPGKEGCPPPVEAAR